MSGTGRSRTTAEQLPGSAPRRSPPIPCGRFSAGRAGRGRVSPVRPAGRGRRGRGRRWSRRPHGGRRSSRGPGRGRRRCSARGSAPAAEGEGLCGTVAGWGRGALCGTVVRDRAAQAVSVCRLPAAVSRGRARSGPVRRTRARRPWNRPAQGRPVRGAGPDRGAHRPRCRGPLGTRLVGLPDPGVHHGRAPGRVPPHPGHRAAPLTRPEPSADGRPCSRNPAARAAVVADACLTRPSDRSSTGHSGGNRVDHFSGQCE